MTTDSIGENVRSKNIPHQELVRNVDTDTTLGLDPWRPLHEACDRLCIQKPKSDLEMQQVGKLWNGRHDVEHGCLDTLPSISNSSAIFPGLVRLDVSGEMHRTVNYTITPGTYLRRPTDALASTGRDDYRVALSRLRFSGSVFTPAQLRLGLPSAWQPRQSDFVLPNHEPPDSMMGRWT